MQRTVVVSFLLMVSALPCVGTVSTNVPLDHWSYDAVDKLAGYGFIDSAMLTTRPISRVEMARHVAQARYRLRKEEGAPAVLTAIMDRLEHEFTSELAAIGILDGPSSDSFFKPVEDPYVKYVHADKPPDIENIRGDTYRRGSNYRAGFASRAALADRFAFYLHPEYTDASESDADVDWIEGYGKAMIGPLEIEAGKDSLWWGPGRHGSILMSHNAAPFTLVKVTNPQPIGLPWILGVLGPFRAEWFLAELEKDRAIPEAKLSGIRLNFKPDPLLEFGLSRIAMFGGRGVPRVDFFNYGKIFLSISEQAQSNQLAGFDASYMIPLGDNPLLRSVRVYGDAAGEDEAAGLPSKWGYLLGLEINDILRTGRTDLRIEYTDTHPLFYVHNLYASGYTYKGRVIGHHAGTDARDLFVQLSHYLTDDILVDIAFDRQIYDASGEAEPCRNVFGFDLTALPSRDWRIEAGYRYEDWDADEADNHVFLIQLIREF